MRYGYFICVLATLGTSAATSQTPATDILNVLPSQVINGTINDQPVTFQVRTDVPPYVILNAQTAHKLGFTPGLFKTGFRIGKVKVPVFTTVAHYAVGAKAQKRRMGWTDRVVSPNADALMGIGALPHSVVTVHLRAPVSGEQLIKWPMVDFGLWNYGTVYTLNGTSMMFQFDNAHATTIASAAAGAAIAKANGGRFVDAAKREMVALNIERPVRTMTLDTPLQIGPIVVHNISVRTAEDGNVSGIPDADADPSEIIVTAPSNPKVRPAYFLIIGTNDMANCSSITFDKPAKQLGLMCRQ